LAELFISRREEKFMPILSHKGVRPKIAEGVFIAPGAVIIGDVTIHEGASVWFNAVIRGDSAPIVIGPHSNIQDNCTLHADPSAPLTIGAFCTVGHNAVVHGATLGDHVLVGMGAIVLNHAVIGSNTILGASSLVSESKQIPEGSLAIGVPAKVVRSLNENERLMLSISAENYSQRAVEYLQEEGQ
jgi:carbonic anhydrase/acetyltransferase-like protein (isoleucine patch superfamily)